MGASVGRGAEARKPRLPWSHPPGAAATSAGPRAGLSPGPEELPLPVGGGSALRRCQRAPHLPSRSVRRTRRMVAQVALGESQDAKTKTVSPGPLPVNFVGLSYLLVHVFTCDLLQA